MSLLPFSRATFGNNPAGEMDMFGLSDPMFGMTEYGWPANTGMLNKHIGQHNLMMDVALFNTWHQRFVQMQDDGDVGILYVNVTVEAFVSQLSGRKWEPFQVVDAGNGQWLCIMLNTIALSAWL
jgi:hypothetical protein